MRFNLTPCVEIEPKSERGIALKAARDAEDAVRKEKWAAFEKGFKVYCEVLVDSAIRLAKI
jgi:hypothetical protein